MYQRYFVHLTERGDHQNGGYVIVYAYTSDHACKLAAALYPQCDILWAQTDEPKED